jgi:hypothetical protein
VYYKVDRGTEIPVILEGLMFIPFGVGVCSGVIVFLYLLDLISSSLWDKLVGVRHSYTQFMSQLSDRTRLICSGLFSALWVVVVLSFVLSQSISGVAISQQPVKEAGSVSSERVIALEATPEETKDEFQDIVISGEITPPSEASTTFIGNTLQLFDRDANRSPTVSVLQKYDYIRSDGELYSINRETITPGQNPLSTEFAILYVVVFILTVIGCLLTLGLFFDESHYS